MDDTVAGLRQVPKESGQDGVRTVEWQEVYERNAMRLREMNPDYIAWLTVPDTEIYYPVVKRDNSYYLYHDFMQQSNSHGAIFMDESCSRDDGVILLHGHHMYPHLHREAHCNESIPHPSNQLTPQQIPCMVHPRFPNPDILFHVPV